MIRGEELMSGFTRFGRGNVQDFVSRSNDVSDAVIYLWAELDFELARVSSLRTINFLAFEKNEFIRYTLNRAESQGHQSISRNIPHAKIN